MIKRLTLLLLIPAFLFGAQLYENRYFWTLDQGFYKLYRQIGGVAVKVDSNITVWKEAAYAPLSLTIADPFRNMVIFKSYLSDTLFYRYNVNTNSWNTWVFNRADNIYDISVAYVHTGSRTILMLGTEREAYRTYNYGSWVPLRFYGEVRKVAVGPAKLYSTSISAVRFYGLKGDGILYRKNGGSALPQPIGALDFYNDGFEVAADSNLSTLPVRWSLNTATTTIRRDTANVNSGSFSLLVSPDTMDVGVRFDYSDTITLNNFFVTFNIYIDTTGAVDTTGNIRQFTSGKVKVAVDGYSSEITLKSNGIYAKGEDIPFDTLYLGTWTDNVISFKVDAENHLLEIYGPGMGERKVVQMDSTGDASGVDFTISPGMQPYYIDDLAIRPELLALAAHDTLADFVYAATEEGIYLWNDTLSTPDWVKLFSYQGHIDFFSYDNNGNYYVAVDKNAHKVYASFNKGNTWSDVTGDLSVDEIYSATVDTDGNIYLGTSDFVYKLSGGSWVKISNTLPDAFVDYVKYVRGISSFNPDTLFAGCPGGGFLVVNDTFKCINDTLLDPSLAFPMDSIVDQVHSFFAGSNGCVAKIEEILSTDMPDVDKNSQVDVLLMDIQDLDIQDQSTVENWCFSYMDTLNEHVNDSLHPYSNHAEIIYADYRKFYENPEKAKWLYTKKIAKLATWWFDKKEQNWLIYGIADYARSKFFFGETPDTNNISIGLTGSGVPLVSNDSTRFADLPYVFVRYVEQRYGITGVRELLKVKGYKVVDPFTGRMDTVILSGTEGVDTFLYRQSTDFEDFIIDFMDAVVKGEITALPNLSITPLAGTNTMGYIYKSSYYSMRGFDFNHTHFDTTLGTILRFNGSDYNKFVLGVYWKQNDSITSSEIVHLTEGSDNIYDTDISPLLADTTKSLLFVVMSPTQKGIDAFYGYFGLDNDLAKGNIYPGVIQSPIAERYLTLYLFTTRRIYRDVGYSPSYPIAVVESDTLTLNYIGTLSDGEYQFSTNYILENTPGTKTFYIMGEDLPGNRYLDSLKVGTYYVTTSGGIVAIGLGNSVVIPYGAIDGNMRAISGRGFAYVDFAELNKPVTLVMEIPEGIKSPVVARFTGDAWMKVGGVVGNGHIEVNINSGGSYRVIDDAQAKTDEKMVFSVKMLSPNVFSDRMLLRFMLPDRGRVKVDVVDASGRVVRTLVDRTLNPGVYYLDWDRKSDTGNTVPSGVYFINVDTEHGKVTSKTVLIR